QPGPANSLALKRTRSRPPLRAAHQHHPGPSSEARRRQRLSARRRPDGLHRLSHLLRLPEATAADALPELMRRPRRAAAAYLTGIAPILMLALVQSGVVAVQAALAPGFAASRLKLDPAAQVVNISTAGGPGV